MLGQRLRRLPSIKQALVESVMFSGYHVYPGEVSMYNKAHWAGNIDMKKAVIL